MAFVKATKTVDSKGRIVIPPDTLRDLNLKPGDKVYFEITRAGSLIVRKVKEEQQ